MVEELGGDDWEIVVVEGEIMRTCDMKILAE